MAHHLVVKEDNRNHVLFSKVKGPDGFVIHFLDAAGRQHDNGMIAVGPPPGLHKIALAAFGRGTGTGTASAHVHHYHRDFGHSSKADVFLHQRKAGTTGGRHRFNTGDGGADGGGNTGNFIFHLDKCAAHQGQSFRHPFGYFCRRRNGVAGKKPHPCRQSAFNASFVALDQLLICHLFSHRLCSQ